MFINDLITNLPLRDTNINKWIHNVGFQTLRQTYGE